MKMLGGRLGFVEQFRRRSEGEKVGMKGYE